MRIAHGWVLRRDTGRTRAARGSRLALAVCTALMLVAALPAGAAAHANLGAVGLGEVVVDDAAQHVFVSAPAANDVDEFDFSGNQIATIPSVYGASGMTLSGSNLYVAESTAGAIVRLDLTVPAPVPVTVASGLNDPVSLVMTGGLLWTAVGGSQWDHVESVDPTSGAITALSGTYYNPDLAVSPADPSTLFFAEDGLSPGAVYRFDVSTSPATQTAHVASTDQENIEDLAVSPDGTRVIPASGAPYEFEELSASTLQPDGLIYPGKPYPSAVAVSASGLLATGLQHGNASPNIAVYTLGAPAPIWSATTADNNVLPHGLALTADGSTLFAVTSDANGDTIFDAYSLSAAPPVSTPTAPITPPVTTPTAPVKSPAKPVTKPVLPPVLQITAAKLRKGSPDASIELGALRVSLVSRATRKVVGYRFYFVALNIHCIGGANDLVVTVGASRRIERCQKRVVVVSPQVSSHRTYRVSVQAVRMRKTHILKRGAVHRGRMYMPGNEAHWQPVSQLPPGI